MSTGVLLVRTVRLALPLYGASLVLALLPGLVVLIGFSSLADARPWRSELLGPNWLNLLAELGSEAIQAGGSRVLALMALAGVVLLPLVAVAHVLVYGYLAGGVLACLWQGHADMATFRSACRRWFWPMLRLSLFGWVLGTGTSFTIQVAFALVGDWLPSDLGIALVVAVQGLIAGWVELARALAVRDETRSVFRAVSRALAVVRRPLVLLLWLALPLPTLGLGFAAINPPALSADGSATDLLAALAYGQGVALLLAWAKVVRLLVAVRLAALAPPFGEPLRTV
ncbi:MAG: hypothetical protein IT306_16040 [Chloroflexi bacterium]|nr:hypothetical protein [Chloroflexota bacterium]